MPKNEGDITVKDLRPLTLIEVTRKIWTSITVIFFGTFWKRTNFCTLRSMDIEGGEALDHKQRNSLMFLKSVLRVTQILGYRHGTLCVHSIR